MRRVFACLLSLLALSASAADLRLLTDNHPPLHFQQNGQMVGFGVDVVQELAQRAGDQVRVEQMPFLRALNVASSAPDTAVFSVLRTAEREAQYQWVGPLLEVETALYARADDTRTVSTLQQAGGLGRIAVPRKWLAYHYLQEQGLNNLYGVETPEQMMRLLRLGRTDLVAVDTLTAGTLADEVGLAPQQLRYQMPLMKQGAFIAFSPQTDARQVARWQQALEQLRSQGRLQQLQQRWLAQHAAR